MPKPSEGGRVTEKEFKEFCDGEDPILKHIKVDPENSKDQAGGPKVSATTQPSAAAATFQNTYQLAPSAVFHPDKGRDIIR